MKYEKGDLVAIRTLDERRQTAIILDVFNREDFFYCHILDDSSDKLIYSSEIEFLISKNFAPDFEYDEEMFNLNYSYYEACLNVYSYAPFYSYFSDRDDSEEDE